MVMLLRVALSVTLLVLPGLRVLCGGSCDASAPEVAAAAAATSEHPVCHDPGGSGPEPDSVPTESAPEECAHGADTSAPGLRTAGPSLSEAGARTVEAVPPTALFAPMARVELSRISAPPTSRSRAATEFSPLRL